MNKIRKKKIQNLSDCPKCEKQTTCPYRSDKILACSDFKEKSSKKETT